MGGVRSEGIWQCRRRLVLPISCFKTSLCTTACMVGSWHIIVSGLSSFSACSGLKGSQFSLYNPTISAVDASDT